MRLLCLMTVIIWADDTAFGGWLANLTRMARCQPFLKDHTKSKGRVGV